MPDHVGASSLPATNRAQGTNRAVPVELPKLRGDAERAAAHARAMAIRQAAGQTTNGATCAGASAADFGASAWH
jgi:hypothetical protein